MTISQALTWMKTLRARHQELVQLRNESGATHRRMFGEKEHVEKPLYNVKALDKLITRLANEVRKLDEAIKDTNAKTEVAGYERDEKVLGEVS